MARKKEQERQETTYTKEQLFTSSVFREDRDLVAALLEDREYTRMQAHDVINRFKKGKVE